jgi:hypothetical protein
MKKAAAVVSLFLLVQAQAFAPTAYRSSAPTSSSSSLMRDSVELYGLRTFLRRRFSSSRSRKTEKTPDAATVTKTTAVLLEDTVVPHVVDTDADTETTSSIHAVVDPSIIAETTEHSSLTLANLKTIDTTEADVMGVVDAATATAVLTLEKDSETDKVNQNEKDDFLDTPFTLQPPFISDTTQQKLTNNLLEQEFRDMLTDFAQFTPRDIRAVRNPRMRALYEGVAASYSLPEVYRAFQVLFEDYAPLRIAGRLIYGKLKQAMVEAQRERRMEVEAVAASTGMSKEEIEASRTSFFRMVVHEDDKATEMTLEQLVDYGLAETAVELLGYESFDEFVEILEPKANQRVGFSELMVALQSCSFDNRGPECNPATVLHEIANRLESREAADSGSLDQRKRKLNARYDGMVEKFREWKDLLPSGDGRRLDILKGCFVGAESKEIVEALRIVYTDYSALRMSGDLIFKVMTTLVKSTMRKKVRR